MFDWAKAVESLGGAIKSASECFAISKKRQSETEILKDKKRLKGATNVAEEIFRLIDENKYCLPDEVIKKYDKLRKEFDEKD